VVQPSSTAVAAASLGRHRWSTVTDDAASAGTTKHELANDAVVDALGSDPAGGRHRGAAIDLHHHVDAVLVRNGEADQPGLHLRSRLVERRPQQPARPGQRERDHRDDAEPADPRSRRAVAAGGRVDPGVVEVVTRRLPAGVG
jgi:hypothetical protein